ncbi:MAG: TonB-dependent receptor, partial [Bacteroidales bacterium]|nr:TonB-dependent receptor [Bacteroidales bacterium]
MLPSRKRQPPTTPSASSIRHPPLFTVYERDADGNRVIDEKTGGWKYDYGSYTDQSRPYAMSINPAGSVAYDVNRIDLDQFVGSGQLEATFLNDFKFTVGIAYNYYDQVRNATYNPYYGDGQAANGRLEKYTTTYRDVTGNQILSWSHTYNGVHHVSAFVGHESYWSETAYSCGKKYNFVQDKVTDYGNAVAYSSLTGYTYGYALDSYFGQVSYDYAEKYFVNASVRADGSSRFAKGHRWGTFGSVGAAWNITKEAFMQDVPFVRNLKLKASWGLIPSTRWYSASVRCQSPSAT